MKILKAKKVYLVDEDFSTANCIVIEGEKIIEAGEFDALKTKYPEAEIVLDHEEQIIYPGFIEPHTHFMGGILPGGMIIVDVMDWEVDGRLYKATSTRQEIFDRIREEIKNDPERTCFFTLGLYEPIHGEVTVEDLNAENFGAPVVLVTNSTHAWYFNDEAMALIGPDLVAGVPAGTYGFELNSDGSFAGVLKEVAVQLSVPIITKYLVTPEVFMRGIKMQHDSNMKKGVTTLVDMAWGIGGALDEQSLAAMTDFPQRLGRVDHWIGMATRIYDPKLSKDENRQNIFEYVKNDFETNGFEQNNKRFTAKGVKFFADGAIIDLEVINSVPDLITGETPEWNHDYRAGEHMHGLETMQEDMELFFKNDYMVHVHTQGDKANQIMLQMFRDLQDKYGKEHNKMSIEHFSFSNDKVFELMDTENSLYISGLPHYGYYFHESWKNSGHVPEEIVNSLTSFKRALECGATLALHSDFMNFPTDPIACLYFATNKINRDMNKEYNDQAISMKDALRGITINAAKNNQLDQYIGSIESGKLADLTVLNVDVLEMNEADLLNTNAVGIYVGGEYHKNNL